MTLLMVPAIADRTVGIFLRYRRMAVLEVAFKATVRTALNALHNSMSAAGPAGLFEGRAHPSPLLLKWCCGLAMR